MRPDKEITDTLLAGRTLIRNEKGGSPGTRYLQRTKKAIKREHRMLIWPFFTAEQFPNTLNILTFPSTNWLFEGSLLNNRHGSRGWHFQSTPPVGVHTRIVGIEREEAIYRSALNLIPGIKHGLRLKQAPPYSTCALRTYAIKRYIRCSFEDLAGSDVSIDCKGFKFNGAWLDFNGPLSLSRKQAIELFLSHHTCDNIRLAITALNGRFDAETANYWGRNKMSAIAEWLESLGGDIRLVDEYHSGVAMMQFVVDKNIR